MPLFATKMRNNLNLHHRQYTIALPMILNHPLKRIRSTIHSLFILLCYPGRGKRESYYKLYNM